MDQSTDTTRPDDMAATLRRINKLLAIASDSRGDPNECAAAARMAAAGLSVALPPVPLA